MTAPKYVIVRSMARLSLQSHHFELAFVPDRKGDLENDLGHIIASKLEHHELKLAAVVVVPTGTCSLRLIRAENARNICKTRITK